MEFNRGQGRGSRRNNSKRGGNSRGRGGFDQRGGNNRAPRLGGFDNRPPRQWHKAVCAECNAECEVPFKPTEGRAVLCKECYKKSQGYN